MCMKYGKKAALHIDGMGTILTADSPVVFREVHLSDGITGIILEMKRSNNKVTTEMASDMLY